MAAIDFRGLVLLLARLVLAWVFISAGLPKIQDPAAFAASIEGYRVVSGPVALLAAVVLPWLELMIGIGLLTPWLRRASAWIIAFLLILFIGLHLSAWGRGLDINCGCFGESAKSPDYHWLILRNLVFLIMAAFILHTKFGNKNAQPNS